MNLLKGKMRIFGLSNIMISFALTSFMGINYCNTYEQDSLASSEVTISETDLEPASQLGDNKIEEVVVTNTTSNKKVTNVVKKKEVAKTTKYTPAVYSEVTGNAVVSYAKKYLGLRYVSGGNSLSTGTDCSGFTKLIYKEFGVSLPRTVRAQTGSGTYVRKSDLQKGDLVFYSNGSGSASHVAIYIGNNQVIHESNHRDGVKISTVNMMHYITARRVINSNAIKVAEEKALSETKSSDTKEKESVSTEVVLNTDNKTIEENNENTKVEAQSNVETSQIDDVSKDTTVSKENEQNDISTEDNSIAIE